MIDPSEALQIVLEKTPGPEPVEVPLLEGVGAVLVEPVASDVDLPPFDKSAMDGYAVRSEDLAHLPVDLAVIEVLPAGTAPTRAVEAGTCAKIMTGAPVPAGADRVVKVEDTEALSEGRVRILRFDAGRNICVRGEDIRKGATVLEAGHVLRPPEIGLLASVGRERVRVGRRPTVAVLATGDELVPVSAVPGPGQIRDANSWSLLACCRGAGVPAHSLGVGRDN
ncbi:MAG: molybdopterin molybdotransferase MoeA, partial [Phycisphaerae bacterium]